MEGERREERESGRRDSEKDDIGAQSLLEKGDEPRSKLSKIWNALSLQFKAA